MRHNWKTMSLLNDPRLKSRDRCPNCGWRRFVFKPPHYGGNGIIYRRDEEVVGGDGMRAQVPDCEPAQEGAT